MIAELRKSDGTIEMVCVVHGISDGHQTIPAPPGLGGVDPASGLRVLAERSAEFQGYSKRSVRRAPQGDVLVCGQQA